jgi:hypothetical protein
MKRFWQFFAICILLLPLIVSAETVSWTPSTAGKYDNGATLTFTSAEMTTMKFYLRLWKEGVTVKTYFGETAGGISTWTDNILVRANQWGASTTGWVPLKGGDNVLVTVSQAFPNTASDGKERESVESSSIRWTLPGYIAPPPPPKPPACTPNNPTGITIR